MTNTNEVRLLPCPFCGGEASSSGTVSCSDKHEAWFSDGTRITKAFYCNCIACSVSNRGLLGHQTREKAITAWNTRTSATSDAARLEHVGTVAKTIMNIDVGWLKDLPAGTYLYAAIAAGGSQV